MKIRKKKTYLFQHYYAVVLLSSLTPIKTYAVAAQIFSFSLENWKNYCNRKQLSHTKHMR